MTALACIQLENGLRPDQVALGLPAGPGAAGGGVVAPVAGQPGAGPAWPRGTNCGNFVPPRTYPGIRGAMTWSINWDASQRQPFAKTVKPHLATLPSRRRSSPIWTPVSGAPPDGRAGPRPGRARTRRPAAPRRPPPPPTFVKTSDWGYRLRGPVHDHQRHRHHHQRLADRSSTCRPGPPSATYWDALLTRSGQHYTFTNRNWNGTIAPGASVCFGFIGAGPGSPTELHRSTAHRAAAGPGTPGAPRRPETSGSPAPPRRAISLAWNASSGTVTGYRVYEGTTVRATVTGTIGDHRRSRRLHDAQLHRRGVQRQGESAAATR